MCHLLTAALPEGVDLRALRRHHRTLLSLEPRARATGRVFGDHVVEVALTRRPCDCGTVFGSANHTTHTPRVVSTDKKVHALRKRGWSEAKIARWAADRERALAKPQPDRSTTGAQVELAQRWADVLRQTAQRAGRIGILLHWYGPEPRSVRAIRQVKAEDVDAALILHLEEDVVMWIEG
ncbi:MAG: hypothetical protein H6733_00010 [Alphaproteobacteria bacterium]|nr:hypothetical protein [Alphaproteobacteria bacterium]